MAADKARWLAVACSVGSSHVLQVLQELLGRRDALPGMAASIQTFGSLGNWNTHAHATYGRAGPAGAIRTTVCPRRLGRWPAALHCTDGLIERGGGFLPLC